MKKSGFGGLVALDLFSGIGGNTLALSKWVRTVAYCESDRHAQSVLLSRMRDGSINPAPIWDDIRTLSKELIAERIDIIVAGFPCQDISAAGKGAGITGSRSGLFFEVVRLIKELRPTFVFLENVPAIRTRGLDVVLRELTQAGYDCRWTMLSAASVGAPHKRERWFLLAANTRSEQLRLESGRGSRSDRQSQTFSRINGETQSVADSQECGWSKGCENTRRISQGSRAERDHGSGSPLSSSCFRSPSDWSTKSYICRVLDGVPFRVDRIKRLTQWFRSKPKRHSKS